MAKRVRKELEQALSDADVTGIAIKPMDATNMHFEASIQGSLLSRRGVLRVVFGVAAQHAVGERRVAVYVTMSSSVVRPA